MAERHSRIPFCFLGAVHVLVCFVAMVSADTSNSVGIEEAGFSDSGARFFDVYDTNRETGYQVLLPDLKFDCHGYISNWSALTVLDSRVIAIVTSFTELQLWRPTVDDPDVYTLVDSKTNMFPGPPSNPRNQPDDASSPVKLYTFEEFAGSNDTRLYFQPSDIVGLFLHSFEDLRMPLGVTFRNATALEASAPNGRVSRLYVVPFQKSTPLCTSSACKPLCGVSKCDNSTKIYDAVVPQLKINYVTLDPDLPTPTPTATCVNVPFESCVTPTSSASPSPTPTQPSGESNTFGTLTIAVIAATGGVCVILLLGIVIILGVCFRRRDSCLRRVGKGKAEPSHYESPDIVFEHYNEHQVPVLRYQASNGDLYTLPCPDTVTEPDMQDNFEVGCYAASYVKNDESHTYQELPEPLQEEPTKTLIDTFRSRAPVRSLPGKSNSWSSLPPNRRMTRSLRPSLTRSSIRGDSASTPTSGVIPLSHMSTSTLNSFRPLPLSPEATATTPPPLPSRNVSHSSLIAPSLVPSPHTGLFPYVDIEGASQDPVSLQPLCETPVTFPYMEPEAISGPQHHVQQIFHEVDEVGYQVPSAEERKRIVCSQSHDVYSRLNRPMSSRSRDSHDVLFFEQSDLFWEPSSSTAELYDQLNLKKYREIQRDQISLEETLGSGHFGTVHKGLWQVPGGTMAVAVKTLHPNSSEVDKIKFLQEAAVMGQFLHPNVVKLHGVVTVGEPLLIVLELMPRGDLKALLRSYSKAPSRRPPDLPGKLVQFCRQIASGMSYLSTKAFVHRDLAARNIFLAEDGTGSLCCKIGDFGMARDVSEFEDSIYESQGGKIPLKWTAPEAIKYRRYTVSSDVWSYGILLYEIWSLGRRPFDRISEPTELMDLMSSGHCQHPPPGCPRALYKLMVLCWNPVPSQRPSFAEVCIYLNTSSDALLAWSMADQRVSDRVSELGVQMKYARTLYPDLQYTYIQESNV